MREEGRIRQSSLSGGVNSLQQDVYVQRRPFTRTAHAGIQEPERGQDGLRDYVGCCVSSMISQSYSWPHWISSILVVTYHTLLLSLQANAPQRVIFPRILSIQMSSSPFAFTDSPVYSTTSPPTMSTLSEHKVLKANHLSPGLAHRYMSRSDR